MKKLISDFKSNNLEKQTYIDQMSPYHRSLYDYCEAIKNTPIESIEIKKGCINFAISYEEAQFIIKTKSYDRRIAPIEIINFGDYEKYERKIISNLSSKSKSTFDIGANIGFYSLLMSRVAPSSTIHSFEPIPFIYEQLVDNISINNIKNVSAHNICLSNTEADVELFYDEEFTGKSSIKNISESSNYKKVKTRSLTLDKFCVDKKIDNIDFIKCDVEGAEKLVIEGAMQSILKFKPVIFLELLRKWSKCFGYHPNELVNILGKIGYKCYAIGDKVYEIKEIDEDTIPTNFLFSCNEIHF